MQIASGDQFFDEKPCHDCLASAGIVGQQETERLAWKHGLVDCSDLVRQRINKRSVDGQDWIKKMCEADAMCFRNEPEHTAISVETPGASLFNYFNAWLIVAVQKDVRHTASRVFVGEFERF